MLTQDERANRSYDSVVEVLFYRRAPRRLGRGARRHAHTPAAIPPMIVNNTNLTITANGGLIEGKLAIAPMAPGRWSRLRHT